MTPRGRGPRRDLATWQRWWPRVFGGVALDGVAIWHRAARDVAARVALAAAREAWVASDDLGSSIRVHGVGELPLRRRGAFGLHPPDLATQRSAVLEDPLAVLDAVVPADLDARVVARLRSELADGTFNLALALAAEHLRPAWAARAPDDERMIDPEHWVTEGHPWHPMSKTRLGLGLAEHAQLAPELAALALVRALDVPQEATRVTDGFADAIAPWLGRAPAGYVRLPVLAIQARRLRDHPTLAQLGTLADRAPLRARALLGLRTVVCPSLGSRVGAHLKLALDVQTTSARRTVSPMSVANGPVISALLRRLAARDPIVARLSLVGEDETAGLRADPYGAAAPQLAAIVRAGETLRGPDGAPAWVCAALGSRHPADGRTLLDHLGSGPMRARALLGTWIEGLVRPCLHLLTRFGVGFEAHLQNVLVVVHAGHVGPFVARDLGGIRLHRPRLAALGCMPDLAPGSFVGTDDLDEVRTKLVHTLIHAHLGTFIGWLADHLGLATDEGWRIVARGLREIFAALATLVPDVVSDVRADEAAFFAPRQRAKALWTMRRDEAVSDYRYIEVDNILADPAIDAGRIDRRPPL